MSLRGKGGFKSLTGEVTVGVENFGPAVVQNSFFSGLLDMTVSSLWWEV